MKYADTIIWYDAPYVYEITYEPTLQLKDTRTETHSCKSKVPPWTYLQYQSIKAENQYNFKS